MFTLPFWGNEIRDPEKRLSGKGNQYHHIKVAEKKEFPNRILKNWRRKPMPIQCRLKEGKQMVKSATIVKIYFPPKKRPV